MPQFDAATYPSQVFWLVICFAFLCIAMVSYVVPRLASSLEAREQRLQEDRDQFEVVNGASESLRQENLQRLADARAKAHSLVHQTIQEVHHRKSSRIAILDEELAIKAKHIRHDLGAQTQDILNTMEPLVSQIVKATSLRILGQSPTSVEIKENVRHVLGKRKQI